MSEASKKKNPLRALTPTEADLDKGGSDKDKSGETLREKATKKLHGEGANPSQLGDPISLKAETSTTIPTDEEAGARPSKPPAGKSTSGSGQQVSTSNGGGEKLREKAAKELHGPDANPSLLGDPISMKNESGGQMPREAEEGGMSRRGSKL